MKLFVIAETWAPKCVCVCVCVCVCMCVFVRERVWRVRVACCPYPSSSGCGRGCGRGCGYVCAREREKERLLLQRDLEDIHTAGDDFAVSCLFVQTTFVANQNLKSSCISCLVHVPLTVPEPSA
mmetsp:Transcript_69773/g.113256  ORF Transcript_69773/g.113256 Transcript_69773/m.113256 type:complete len:124 (-) Transcript_69773:44-415(-)